MKQYRIKTEHLPQDSNDDAVLPPDDPIHELKAIQYLAGLGATARLTEYRTQQNQINNGSNISVTGTEKAQLMKQHNIKPGTPEWFRLWFSRPYLTGGQPVGNKNETRKR